LFGNVYFLSAAKSTAQAISPLAEPDWLNGGAFLPLAEPNYDKDYILGIAYCRGGQTAARELHATL